MFLYILKLRDLKIFFTYLQQSYLLAEGEELNEHLNIVPSIDQNSKLSQVSLVSSSLLKPAVFVFFN